MSDDDGGDYNDKDEDDADGGDYNDKDEDDADGVDDDGGDGDLKHVCDSFERSSIPWQPFQWQESVVNIS